MRVIEMFRRLADFGHQRRQPPSPARPFEGAGRGGGLSSASVEEAYQAGVAVDLHLLAVADRRRRPPVPTTAGMPYSRATTAQWLRMPPASVTTAETVAKSGVQGGAVNSATRTSPGRSRSASSSERTIRAVPLTLPGEPALPRSSPGASEMRRRAAAEHLDDRPADRVLRRRAGGRRPEDRRRGDRVGGVQLGPALRHQGAPVGHRVGGGRRPDLLDRQEEDVVTIVQHPGRRRAACQTPGRPAGSRRCWRSRSRSRAPPRGRWRTAPPRAAP